MSGAASRRRRRRQRFESDLREALTRAQIADAKAANARNVTPGHGELWRLLCEIERSDLCVWEVAGAICCTEDERAMIAQVVAPRLAGMTPASVRRRPERADPLRWGRQATPKPR